MRYFVVFLIIFTSACSPIKKNTMGYKLNPNAYKINEQFKDGYLYQEVPYNKNLEIEGFVVQYYREGNPQIVYEHHDGMKNGHAVWYYENGQLYIEVNYVNNEFDGVLTKYYDDGSLQSKTSYKNGELLPGTIEYNQLGDKLDSIELIIDVKNTLSTNYQYSLTFSLSENVSNVLYYSYEEEVNGGYNKYRFETENDIGTHVITVMPGLYYNKNYKIVAIGETILNNRFMIVKDYSVNIRNTF